MVDRLDSEFKYYKERLKYHILQCVKIGAFTLSSGKKSNFYVDCKQEMLTPECCEFMAMCIRCIGLSHIHDYRSVAGVASGADPITVGCVAYNRSNGLFIRKAKKGYGIRRLIEGKIITLDPKVLLVDDVLTTGGALKHAFAVLTANGLELVGTVVIVDRQENDAKKIIEKYTGKPVWPIFTRDELMHQSEEK